MAQREKSWYMLAFQFAGIAEQWLSEDGWRNFRDCFAHPEADAVAQRLADPAHLTATLWSDGDRFLLEPQMTGSADYVSGPWRYERIDGAGHWMTLEAPARVSELLVDFLASV